MKKIVLIVCTLLVAVVASAQEGRFYTGGALGFWHNGDADQTTLTIAPELGYNLNDMWAFGVTLAYSHIKQEVEGTDFKLNMYGLEPYARCTFFRSGNFSVFADGMVGLVSVSPDEGDSSTMFEIGIQPGIAFNLDDHFSILGKFGFLGYRDTDDIPMDIIGYSNGFGAEFDGTNIQFGLLYTF